MDQKEINIKKKLSPLNAWAFAFACMIGWGAFVMPATYFLPIGGIWGALLAFLCAGIAMCIVAVNFSYLGNTYPEVGGSYFYVKAALDRRQAFVVAWAMGLAYLCCIPLNARAMGMLIRTILEEAFHLHFQTHFLSTNIMLIDMAIVVIALVIFSAINIIGLKQTALLQTIGAILLIGGILIMLVASLIFSPDPRRDFTPAYAPGSRPLLGFMTVFLLTPWAFVGFESLTNVVTEFSFPIRNSGKSWSLPLFLAQRHMSGIFSRRFLECRIPMIPGRFIFPASLS